MDISKPPIDVSISIENPTLDRDAFYNVCFITESDTSPRDFVVYKLQDLFDNGFNRNSLAYNFCIAVFAQQAVDRVYIRSKRSSESYEDAFDASDNSSYYHIVIESKNLETVKAFNTHVNSVDKYKLQHYSNLLDNESVINQKIVNYSHDLLGILEKSNTSLYYLDKAYDLGLGTQTPPTIGDAQLAELAYPEAAWIGLCANSFPSTVNWLHKTLYKVSVSSLTGIPEHTSTYGKILKDSVTVGSGTTGQGFPIQMQISLDWVAWAISRNVWSTMYTQPRLTYSKGLYVVKLLTKQVLDTAVEQDIFLGYKLAEPKIAMENTISLKFTAQTTYTVNSISATGTLYY